MEICDFVILRLGAFLLFQSPIPNLPIPNSLLVLYTLMLSNCTSVTALQTPSSVEQGGATVRFRDASAPCEVNLAPK